MFDELQLGAGFISRQFHYHEGEVTDEHKNNDMLKSTPTTQLISQIVLSGGRTISYEYDEEERITKVDDSVDGITTYTYDALGQLLTETKGGVTTKFEYDNYGNILAKGVVDETGEIAEATKVTYEYNDGDWKDLLTAYNGQSITYDAQGNPTSYLGHNLTWEKGRQLKKFDGVSYTYNANGIRTSKNVYGTKHDYVLDGAKIVRETWGNNVRIPMYDNEDSVCGIIYNDVPYYFQKNLQGDVIAITNSEGTVIGRYSYDAWGVCTVTQDNSGCDIANINPFRYRGYYFDKEIGMYYLQSRYYDPTVGRFVNGDEIENALYTNNVLDYNTFTYIQNNPVVLSDSTGESWITDLLKKVKNGASYVWGWIKKATKNIGSFFKNTVWKKWIVNGVWNTFCKKWVWETFCKKWVCNTFFKKWVWQTFCKKWTWNTFCKKWVWQTFCKKWVWQTFCKDWIANKAWNWFNGPKWYQSLVRNLTIGVLGGIVGALLVWIIPFLSTFAAATLGLTVLGGIITGVIGGIVSWLYDLIA